MGLASILFSCCVFFRFNNTAFKLRRDKVSNPNCFTYKKCYDRKVRHDFTFNVNIKPSKTVKMDYVTLTSDGVLKIKEGYHYDSHNMLSFLDTPSMNRAIIIRDALLQILVVGNLNVKYRRAAERVYREVMIKGGTTPLRAWYHYLKVRLLDDEDVYPETAKNVCVASGSTLY